MLTGNEQKPAPEAYDDNERDCIQRHSIPTLETRRWLSKNL